MVMDKRCPLCGDTFKGSLPAHTRKNNCKVRTYIRVAAEQGFPNTLHRIGKEQDDEKLKTFLAGLRIPFRYGAGCCGHRHQNDESDITRLLFVPSWVGSMQKHLDSENSYSDDQIDMDRRLLCVEALRFGANSDAFHDGFEAMAHLMLDGKTGADERAARTRLHYWTAEAMGGAWDPFCVANAYIGGGI